MTDSKDTQEEKPQPDGTVLPPYLNLTVHREEQGGSCYNLFTKSGFKEGKFMIEGNYLPNLLKGSGKNVMLECAKLKGDERTRQPTWPNYSCIYELTSLNCSAINFIRIYYMIPCPKEGQEPLESYKCWVMGTEDPKNMDMCCLPEMLKNVTLKDTEEEPRCPSPTMLPLPPTWGPLDPPGGHCPAPKGHRGPLIHPGLPRDPWGPPTPGDHQGPPTPGDHHGSATPGITLGHQDLGITLGHPTPPRATEKQQLSTVDHQEATLEYQTLKTPWDPQTSPGTSRSSREWHIVSFSNASHVTLGQGTTLHPLSPRLGQDSSKGWIAVGVVAFLVIVVILVIRRFPGFRRFQGFLVSYCRGQNEEQPSSTEAIRMERLEEGEDGDRATPGM